jgi:hypothetical protein
VPHNKKQQDAPEFTPEDLREWQIDKRGARYWKELEEMANKRVNGISDRLNNNDTAQALILNGELNGIRECMQLVDIIIDENKEGAKQ